MFDIIGNSLLVGLIQVTTGWSGQGIGRDYPPVSAEPIRSDHYEIQQVIGRDSMPNMDRSDGGRVELSFEPFSQTVIATTGLRYLDDDSSGQRTGLLAVRIDGDGEVVNTLDWSGRHWGSSGVVFEQDAYMDWVRTGDDSRQPYAQVLNQDDVLDAQAWAEQFRQLYGQAGEVYFYTAPGEWASRSRAVGYFHLDSGWVALYGRQDDPDTRLGFNPGSEPIMAGFPDYAQKKPYVLQPLEGALQPFHDWADEARENRLSIVHFNRERYHRSPLLTADAPRLDSGFHGIAAFRLHHNQDTLQFSAYSYEVKTLSNGGALNGYRPGLTLYDLPPEVPGSDHLALLNLFNSPVARRPEHEVGLYVIRRAGQPSAD